jgi:putative transferase (TIGR04331 family)
LIDSKSEWFQETTVTFQQVLDQVASNLNEIHSVNYSTRYWNIFVGEWLQHFVDMVMFRMFEIHGNKRVPIGTQKFLPTTSLRAFNDLAKRSSFVEKLHADVLQELKNPSGTTTINVESSGWSSALSQDVKLGRKFVSATYLPRLTEYLFQLRFGRFPHRLNFSNTPSSTNGHELRALVCKTVGSQNINAEVILTLLPKYMPSVYLEGFNSLFQSQKPWKSKTFPRVIFTANRHLYDDGFNFWTAHAIENGSRLVLAQHGGNYGISEFPSFSERHENLVADRYITWGWNSTGPTYKGFALPLIGRALYSSQPNGPLLVITDQLWKYPRSIFSDTPESSTYLGHLKSTIDGLLPEIRSETLLRIHHAHEDAGSSQIDWWKLNSPDIRQDVGEVGFQKRLAESRLVLIAHNGTSIPESIALHAPTIITWSDSYMKVRQSAEAVFDALEQVGVFHRTPESAASFINSIWDDVDGWWNSPTTINARKQFTDQYARTVSNPVRFLAKALQF